jgi:hypothetical protein
MESTCLWWRTTFCVAQATMHTQFCNAFWRENMSEIWETLLTDEELEAESSVRKKLFI